METTTDLTWTLGDRLRKARRAAGLSATEMAERLMVNRNSVSNWENDHNRPRPRDLLAWADACGVDVEWLMPELGTPVTRRSLIAA
jgi:transcriptional regulator with XRE-family HTH domain